MKDLTCFGENAVQVADVSCSRVPKLAQNMVTCIYQCTLFMQPCIISITWSKNLVGHCLGIEILNSLTLCLCKSEIKPWLFSRKKGSKELQVNSSNVEIYWDLTSAKFGSGPEPLEEFYLAVVSNGEIVLLIGDMRKEAYKKTNSTPMLPKFIFISRREHIYGKKAHHTKAQFCDGGQIHDIRIESVPIGPSDFKLIVCIDSKEVLQVRRLRWKFRGNKTIVVDGAPVEIFWDVYNWLFGTAVGNAVFMFQTCLTPEKLWTRRTSCDPFLSPWHFSQKRANTAQLRDPGFSLTLYAWRNE